MKDYKIGDIAISRAGRDKDRYYLIIDIDSKYIYLSDGRYHKIEEPKRKNFKHVSVKYVVEKELRDKISTKKLTNEDVKFFLKNFGGKNV